MGVLARWHRRAGLLAALFLAFVALTGLLLNHSDGLDLADRRVESDWLRRLYSERPVPVRAWQAGGQWVAQAADGELLLDAVSVGACEGQLMGALLQQGMIVIACSGELLLLTPDGERIDSISRATGLVRTLDGLGADAEGVRVSSERQWYALDLDTLVVGKQASASAVALPGVPPVALAARIDAAAGWLNWERALLDLHSGRVLGRFGILLMDITALLAIALSLSGTLTWYLRRRARSRGET